MSRRAVILGGGGVTGIAWQTGLLYGLTESGQDLAPVDAVIGTSAGAFAGAHLAAGVVREAFACQFQDAPEIPADISAELVARYRQAIAAGRDDPSVTGRLLGDLARTAPTVSAHEREEVVRSRLQVRAWPSDSFAVTVVDADSGELSLLRRGSGVDLVTAAAASGAVAGLWPPVTAAGRTWIDGGTLSATNALAGRDFDHVLVIAPIVDGFAGQTSAHEEVDALKADGVAVHLIHPDNASLEAMGDNPFDPSHRARAAEAGRAQGRASSEMVSALWAASVVGPRTTGMSIDAIAPTGVPSRA
jgi:NTE family protein